ncbi:hypothetical protein D3C87_1443600 [compost metagenome]
MHGHIGAAAHGDADVRRRQGRCIVDAVTDHRHHAGFLQRRDGGGFVGRQHFSVHVGDAQRLGNDFGTATVVTSQQVTADVPCIELLNRLQCAGFQGVTEGEQAQHFRRGALLDQPGERPAFGFPRSG